MRKTSWEMLKEEVKWGGDRKLSSIDTTLKLADLGISKDQSSRSLKQ